MRYGFISRRNKQTIEKHMEALKPYDLTEIIIDDFTGDLDNLFEKLKTGDSLYIEEPPRDTIKFVAIHSYTRKHGIELYVNGKIVEDLPHTELFDAYIRTEITKRMHKVN